MLIEYILPYNRVLKIWLSEVYSENIYGVRGRRGGKKTNTDKQSV